MDSDDERFMREALKEARRAFAADEVPVGAVVVCGRVSTKTPLPELPSPVTMALLGPMMLPATKFG